jgi:hypothetical protein
MVPRGVLDYKIKSDWGGGIGWNVSSTRSARKSNCLIPSGQTMSKCPSRESIDCSRWTQSWLQSRSGAWKLSNLSSSSGLMSTAVRNQTATRLSGYSRTHHSLRNCFHWSSRPPSKPRSLVSLSISRLPLPRWRKPSALNGQKISGVTYAVYYSRLRLVLYWSTA